MLVVVAGSHGVGKTTILKRCAGYKEMKSVVVGDLMLEEAEKIGFRGGKDKIRRMKPEQQVKLREAVFRRISRLRGNYIIDTHFVVGSEGRYVQGLPYSVIRLLKNVGGLICIDAPTKEIIGRQVSDKSRKREIEEEMFVDAERTMNMSVSSYLSWYLDVPMYFIENRNGRLEESVRTFKNAVSALING